MHIIALDTETALFGPGNMAPQVTCVTLAHEHGAELITTHGDDRMRERVLEILKDQNSAVVGHNIAYDMAVLCAEFNDAAFINAVFDAYYDGRVCDTMIREQLIDVAGGPGLRQGKGVYSLAGLVKRRIGIVLDKDSHRLNYGALRGVPADNWPQGAVLYALDDAKHTLNVYKHQHEQADDYRDEVALYALVNELEQTRGAFALHLQSVYGVITDSASIDAVEARVVEQYKALQAELIKAGVLQLRSKKHPERGYKMTRKFVTDRVEDVCDDAGVEVPRSEKGNTKTDRMTLNDTGDALLHKVALFKEQEKNLSTYIPLLRQGQIHTRYGFVNSGRTSSSPNQQNWPRAGGFRECIKPRDGYVLCSVDFDTAELRSLSAFCEETFGYSRMAEVLRAGDDPHLMLAAVLLGISHDEAKLRKKDKDVKDARNLAKTINFAWPGGRGARAFVLACKRVGIIITLQRAKELKALWLRTWPEMVEFFQYASLATAQNGLADVVTPWSKRVRADCYYTEFCNQHFQGPVADAAKAATFALAYECYTGRPFPGVPCDTPVSPLRGSRPVLFIHDENIAELPANNAAAAAWRMATVMSTVGSTRIPRVPLTCKPALMLRWSKGADTVLNEQGELIVWKQ